MPLTKLLFNVILFLNAVLWMAVVAMLLNAEPNVVAGTRAVSHVRQMAWTAAWLRIGLSCVARCRMKYRKRLFARESQWVL